MKSIVKIVFLVSSFLLLASCSHKDCKIENRKDVALPSSGEYSSKSKDLSDRIFVFKPDGTLQCGMGKKIELNDMQKELGGIQVFSSANKHDGLMRIQVCGQPTGNSNVFEISNKDLEKALQAGFKKWLRE